MAQRLFSTFQLFLHRLKDVTEKALTFLSLHLIYFLGIGFTSLVSKVFRVNFFEAARSRQKDSNWRPFVLPRDVSKMY